MQAQDAVWLVPAAQQHDDWYGPIRAGLEAEGVIVRDAAPDAAACDPACLIDSAREMGLRAALRVRVQRRADRVESARLVLETVDGREGEGTLDLANHDRTAAARAAYRSAELALRLGELGLLRVHTSPEGVLVTIDGEAAGLAPLERKLAPGSHEVALALSGFSSEQHRVQVERGRASELDLRLTRVANMASVSPARSASPLNFILGGALVAAAAPALIFSIATLASDGDCHKYDTAGGCMEQVHFGARSGLLLGLGSAALVGAGVLFIAAPFTVEAQAGQRGTRLSATLRF